MMAGAPTTLGLESCMARLTTPRANPAAAPVNTLTVPAALELLPMEMWDHIFGFLVLEGKHVMVITCTAMWHPLLTLPRLKAK